jgi:hypothetical protein
LSMLLVSCVLALISVSISKAVGSFVRRKILISSLTLSPLQ